MRDDWLVGGKRKRRADIALTQGSDGLSQSQSSNATSEAPSKSHDDEYTESPKSEFSDDVSESGEDNEDSKRSLNTEGEVEENFLESVVSCLLSIKSIVFDFVLNKLCQYLLLTLVASVN